MRIGIKQIVAATAATVALIGISNPAYATYDTIGSSAVVATQTVSIIASTAAGVIASGIGSGISGGGGFSGGGFTPGGAFGSGGGRLGLNGIRSGASGLSAGDGEQRFGIWTNGSYSHIKFDNATLPFDGDTFIGMIGADYRLPTTIPLVIGISGGYENDDITTTFNNGTLKTNGYIAAPYLAVGLGKYLTLSGSAGYTWLSNDMTRTSGAIRGSYDSKRWFGLTSLSGNYSADKWLFNGYVSYIYSHQTDDAFTESGVGGGAVGENTTKVGQGRVGAKIGYDFNGFVPYVTGRIEHEFTHPGGVVVGGTTVTNDDTGYSVGAGFNYTRGPFSAGLLGETDLGRSDLTVYRIIGNIRFQF